MKTTKEQRAEKRFIRQQSREFRALFNKVKGKLKKSVMTKANRLELLEDMKECNNIEIMHYLGTVAVFNSDHSFIEVINKALQLETITYAYPLPLVYRVGNMKDICLEITKHHNYLDLKAKFINPVDNE